MAGWKNKYGNTINKYTEANDGIVFATARKEGKNDDNKKDITCYKCGKVGHYSNECDKEQVEEKRVKTSNKKGSSFLVVNHNQHGYSLDRDNTAKPPIRTEFMAIQEANEEEEETDIETEEGSNQDTNDKDNELTESEHDEDDGDDDDYQGYAFLHNDVVCSTQDKAGIPKNWILMNSQSTVDVFSNTGLLTNI